MFRPFGSARSGGSFTPVVIDAVWQKGRIVPGWNPARWRQDSYGTWMMREAHGAQGPFGWEIDHRFPASRGGADALDNLQPLQWQNNRRKSDAIPLDYFLGLIVR